MNIEATNCYYFRKICKIGGIETFFYELAKKYHDIDLVVIYKDGDDKQLRRLKKYVKCIKYTGQQIKCKKMFFNFNYEIIDNVEAEEYCLVVHGNYKWLKGAVPTHPKITKYYGVSQDSCEAFTELTGIPCELCYNPISKEEVKPVIRIVMACRLNDPIKGYNRTVRLIKKMDEYCELNNRQYQLDIFTNPVSGIDSPNVNIMQPRLDIRPFIADADFVMQLSDNFEGYNYTINESLLYGTPIIVTPCGVYKELGLLDNAIVLNFNCSNLDEVVEQVFNKKIKVNYTPKEDRWNELLINVKSNYIEEEIMKNYYVKATRNFTDSLEGKHRVKDDEFLVNKERYEFLKEHNAVELIEVIVPKVEKKKEDKELMKELTEKATKKNTKKK